jgi:hypothetical protein
LAGIARPAWLAIAALASAALLHSLLSAPAPASRSELAIGLGLPISLLGLAGLALGISRIRAAALLLAAMALAVSLAIGEAVLTAKAALQGMALPQGGGADALDSLRAARAQGRDLAPSFSMLQAFRGQGVGQIASRLTDERGELIPLAGLARSETLYCRREAHWLSYRSDELGFRNPPGGWNGGPVAAVLLGDSFVLGHCVGDDREMGALLRRRLGPVLNLAQGGRGPLFQLATLVEYGPVLRPRSVLWFYVDGDDIEDDLAFERQSGLLRRYLESDFRQGLFERRDAVDASLRAFFERALATAAAETAGRHAPWWREAASFAQLRGRLQAAWQAVRPADLELFRQILRRAQATAATWEGQLVLVDLAQQSDLRGGEAGATRRQVHAIVRELGIPLIVLAPVFRATGGALFEPGDGHYAAAGYALAAEHIARQLAGPPVIPQRSAP